MEAPPGGKVNQEFFLMGKEEAVSAIERWYASSNVVRYTPPPPAQIDQSLSAFGRERSSSSKLAPSTWPSIDGRLSSHRSAPCIPALGYYA